MDDDSIFIQPLLKNTHYQYHSKLSQGSYAQVYKLIDRNTNQPLALKVLDLQQINKLGKIHELMIQVNLLKRLKHPGIIKLSQTLRNQGYMGLVMELGTFGDLYQLIKKINKKEEFANRKIKIMKYYLAQILESIDHLHSEGIVHRDIKVEITFTQPQNIVLGSDLRIRIIDLATALITPHNRMFSPEETQQFSSVSEIHLRNSCQIIGSANYISPQSLKLQYSFKCDIWSFGILIYKFYFNTLPFDGASNLQIFQQILQDQISLPKIEPWLQQLLILCLKKDPEERATAKMLKMCSFFKDIDFNTIFQLEPPIFKEEMALKTQIISEFLFELELDKKMFFGNFKPRILTMQQAGTLLKMAYRYVPSKQIKNEFNLSMNDYASVLKQDVFEVIAGNKKYCFRTHKGKSAEEVVSIINSIIKKFFCLQ